jgi:hypothetical protein
MMQQPQITRRRFLNAAVVGAGGALLVGRRALGAGPAQQSESLSTPHFWYRLQPPPPLYVDSQRGHKAFAFTDNQLWLSEDNGQTWPHRADFMDAQHVTFSYFLRNGNLLFATRNRLFLSTDNLKTITPVTVQDTHGVDYLPHTPRNPANPGWYFHTLSGVSSWDIDGREILLWGNYCSVIEGAAPVNLYYSTDNGRTVKIAYAFGQNPYHRDNGSGGGGPEGDLLGDPDNPVFCRHIHSVAYNPAENAFYACTGDHDRAEGYECHWLRGVYDWSSDTWDWKVLVSDKFNSRYKSGGINFVDGMLYWISDANGPEPHDRGIFRCAPADLAEPKAHTRLFHPRYECAIMLIQDQLILATHLAPASPFSTGVILSPDLGRTWVEYDLKEFGRRSPTRIHPPNAEGWFRADLRTGWINRADVLFLKPK